MATYVWRNLLPDGHRGNEIFVFEHKNAGKYLPSANETMKFHPNYTRWEFDSQWFQSAHKGTVVMTNIQRDMAARAGMGIRPAVVPLGSSRPPQFFTRNAAYFGRRKDSRWSIDAHWDSYNAPSFSTLKEDVENAAKHVEMLTSTRLKQEEKILIDLKHNAAENDIWEDIANAQETFLALVDTEENISLLKDLRSKVEDAKLIIHLAEMEAVSAWLLDEAYKIIVDLNKSLNRYELSKLVSGQYDKEGACLTITARGEGTDAQEWANILLSMYLGWAEKQGYKARVVENILGEKVGIKSATAEFEWRFAYGFLSGERGTHQIIRQSSFNTYDLHWTSIVGVDVIPLFVENSLDIEIPDEDLEISYSISSGKGSQSVNKVETAVHILHIPTGISVNCTGERSQLANKIKALYRLKAKLHIIAMEQQASDIKQISRDNVNCGCDQQIRDYVFHPKKLVRDVRTGVEVSDITSVMNGDLEPFIKSYLMFKHMKNMTSNIND